MAISPTNIRILFTNYDIIAYFLNLTSCSEHLISIKHRILATFNIKKNQSERLYAFKYCWIILSHRINTLLSNINAITQHCVLQKEKEIIEVHKRARTKAYVFKAKTIRHHEIVFLFS